MKKAVDENLLERDAREFGCHGIWVKVCSQQAIDVVDLDGGHVAEGKNPLAASFPNDFGSKDSLVAIEVLGEALEVHGLMHIVNFFEAGDRKFFDQCWCVGAT